MMISKRVKFKSLQNFLGHKPYLIHMKWLYKSLNALKIMSKR